MALCGMLLTACGNGSGQTGNAGAMNPTEGSSTVQSLESGNQDNEVITGTEVQSGITDAADNGQTAESTGSGQSIWKQSILYETCSGSNFSQTCRNNGCF